MDFGARYIESKRTMDIEVVLEAVRTRLKDRGYTVAPGLTVRRTVNGAEHFILTVDRGGATRECHLTVAADDSVASSVVRTRRVAGRRERDVARETAVPDIGRYDAARLADDLVAELP